MLVFLLLPEYNYGTYIVIKTIEITMAKRPKRNYEAFFNQASSVLQKFVFIKGVDKGWITTEKDLESWRFDR